MWVDSSARREACNLGGVPTKSGEEIGHVVRPSLKVCGVLTSSSTEAVMGNPENSRKSAEGFVSWKGRPRSQPEEDNVGDPTSKSAGGGSRKEMTNSGSYGVFSKRPQSPSQRVTGMNGSANTLGGLQGRHQQHASLYVRNAPRQAQGGGSAPEGIVTQEASWSRPSSPHMPRKASSGIVYKDRGVPGTSQRCLYPESKNGNNVCVSAASQHMQTSVSHQQALHPSRQGRHLHSPRRRKLSSVGASFDVGERRSSNTSANMEDELQLNAVAWEDDDNFAEGSPLHTGCQPCAEEDKFPLYDDDVRDNVEPNSEDEGDAPIEEEHAVVEEMEDSVTVYGVTAEEESAKRRERRQAQAMREKEAYRRRREGLPRNFLLVDEYTGKPYETGVGDWRKELMLLSKDLDPAIGNINQQPEGAVAEIANWIQHTWEYGAPVKFQYVKEVIARGVTLRRRDLWNRMHNNEPKPEGVTDRTWRTLERLLQSDATVRKSENCSRANASRVNFGRTGPSGEVGVRERLRKKLRRSPEPEEIRIEMCRDKGYGGRSKRKPNVENVMHGSQSAGRTPQKVARMNAPCRSVGIAENKEEVHEGDGHESTSVEDPSRRERRDEARREGVLTFSSEDVLQHPLVIQLMQRLEALESRQSATEVVESGTGIKQFKTAEEEEEVSKAVQKERTAKERGDKVGLQLEGPHVHNHRTVGRLKKKV